MQRRQAPPRRVNSTYPALGHIDVYAKRQGRFLEELWMMAGQLPILRLRFPRIRVANAGPKRAPLDGTSSSIVLLPAMRQCGLTELKRARDAQQRLVRPIQKDRRQPSFCDSGPSAASAASARPDSSTAAASSRLGGNDFVVLIPSCLSISTWRTRLPRPSLSFFIAFV